MKFLFLIHGDDEAEAALTPDERRAVVGEHIAYAAMLRERGAYVLGEALAGRESAAVVRPGEKPFVTRRPVRGDEGGGRRLLRRRLREPRGGARARRTGAASPGAAVEVLTIAELLNLGCKGQAEACPQVDGMGVRLQPDSGVRG